MEIGLREAKGKKPLESYLRELVRLTPAFLSS